jgi:hypothetical protein
MPFKTRLHRILLAAALLTAFSGMAAHEAAHVEHAPECSVCHAAPTSLPAAAAVFASLFFVLLFRLSDPGRRSPEGLFLSVRPGRAPPVLLA